MLSAVVHNTQILAETKSSIELMSLFAAGKLHVDFRASRLTCSIDLTQNYCVVVVLLYATCGSP